MLGDEYISQHIQQAYREYIEQTSYKQYMSNITADIASVLYGSRVETRWSDILNELDGTVTPEKQTETEQEVKSRLLAKLNGREGA